MEPLDIVNLDRSIARATSRARQYLRRLQTNLDATADESWHASDRHTSTRSTFLAVSELPASDPWRENLRRWVYVLALTRIAEPYMLRVIAVRNARELRFEVPEPGTFSARDVVTRVVSERSADKREAWIRSLAAARDGGRAIRAAEHGLADALHEIESRLGEDPSTTQLCLPLPRSAAVALAQDVFKATRDAANDCLSACGTFGGVLGLLTANEVPGVWPAQPNARWLTETVGAPALIEGLALDMGPLPRSIGASSFARALCRFGAAYARAAAPREAPFVLAHDPTLLHPYRRGALFGSLLTDPVFLRSRLGFSRDSSRAVARSMAITFLGAARLEAARAQVDFAAAPTTDVEGVLEEAFRVPYPRALARVLPKPCRHAVARLAAMVLATADRDALVEEYDEDWFRNPRALSHLRELDSIPPCIQFEEASLRNSARKWADWIVSAVS